MADIAEYISALLASEELGSLVVHHEVLPSRRARHGECRRPWPVSLERVLDERGVGSLYSHQARAMDILRAGRGVVAATPTASGKTLIYTLPVMEQILADPDARALYLFPLKALAQDQFKAFEAMAASIPEEQRPRAAIYDGDTSPWFRKKIREHPPHVLMTNPEMLHLAVLPHHDKWAAFLAGLNLVVVDEMHTYRGVLGSHMAQVFRRLGRVCARYGSQPRFAMLSATVGNPRELARQLAGPGAGSSPDPDMEAVTDSGAPMGKRHFLFLNPALRMKLSPSQAAIGLLKAALAREMRTIVYVQSRRMAELIGMWASQRAGPYTNRISAYRAGFLPEERRDIEARMASGDLLAVVSTSALELGIDIGALDLCILVGYPGTIMSTLQRGGRVGRASQESAVVLVAGEDALDQYFMRHPRDFFDRAPECAVLNPANEVILARHLVCAAAEMPLRPDEPWFSEPGVRGVADALLASGDLLEAADGQAMYAKRKRPHHDVNLRGTGGTFGIYLMAGEDGKGTSVGQVDEHRAFKETHPGAVYLHRGETFVVRDLDLETRSVRVARSRVDYFTRVRTRKETEILAVTGAATAWGARIFKGRLKVTETVTGYEKRRVRGQALMTIVPLNLPPLVFETEGLWIEVPRAVQRLAEDQCMHFMGGIHALEHAAIGILPLLVMTDRNDLGGISTPFHEQVGAAAVFVYDGVPGGVGLSSQAFGQADELLERTLAAIVSCPCELGCPSCVHSPKCGSGNRPIDKGSARFILEAVRDAPRPEPGEVTESMTNRSLFSPPDDNTKAATDGPRPPRTRESATPDMGRAAPKTAPAAMERGGPVGGGSGAPLRFGAFDLETRRSAQDVGGWGKAFNMGVSVAVLYDSGTDQYTAFAEDEVKDLIRAMQQLDLVVGFNIRRFDYLVLKGVSSFDFNALPTLDMLQVVHERLGYRLSLDSLAKATLDAPKTADGLQALEWWKQGELQKITDYCIADVRITRDLYLFGRDNGYVLFTNKAGNLVRLPVEW